MADVGGGFTKYPRIIKVGKPLKQELVSTRGFLDPKTYQYLPLVEKTEIAPDVFRLSFELPTKTTILGLPAGQHVAIKADINGQSVSRSYTPVSNNTDLGRLELVIRCYADGLLTGQYLRKLELGDEVAFRGPKGAMRYKRGLTKRIGMIAGGTGITPMYQLIRAICEDDEDLTEVSLIYANRSEQDVLLREELEAFARRYPKNFKLWYMLDKAPEGWQYGVGYVNKDVIRAHLPAPSADSKVMICGPPGMVNACKKALASVGFQLGGAVPKMTDQVFTF
jgi:cytochrome-b5 reductase